MAVDLHDTEVVFLEIQRAYVEILENRRRPAVFRRAFEEYVTKSQHLTEVMRVEFARYTGEKWQAATYSGWNQYTHALKIIRRSTFHGYALQLYPAELTVYPRAVLEHAFPRTANGNAKSKYGVMKGRSFVANQFATDHLGSRLGLPVPGEPGAFCTPLKEFVSYELSDYLRDDELERTVRRLGTRDAVKITLKSYPALKRYFEFYERSLAEQRKL